jgi:hypothetical protein
MLVSGLEGDEGGVQRHQDEFWGIVILPQDDGDVVYTLFAISPNLRLVSIFMNRATAVESTVTGLVWF